MMVHIEEQQFQIVEKSQIVEKAAEFFKQGFRLVAITCAAKESFELTYSFDKDMKVTNVRVVFPKNDPTLPSITGSYFAAFTYENELHDLFGISVSGLALDFKGKFYKLSVPTPFAPQPQPPVK
jgi:ech hydrogenase subunit D